MGRGLEFLICVIRSIISLSLAYFNRSESFSMQPFLMPSSRHISSASELATRKPQGRPHSHPHFSFSARESQSAITTAGTRDPPRCIFFLKDNHHARIAQSGLRCREVLRRCWSRSSEASQRVGGRKSKID